MMSILRSVPSQLYDSGAIDVGGTTLDDILAQWPGYSPNHSQEAMPETRWDGFASFSTGFGSRVNVAAPSDNVVALEHNGANADSVAVVLTGGTSASAPETAAAAAVVLQVARLTGRPLASATAVRKLLEQTGSSVADVPQADMPLQIGSQIDVRRAVEELLHQANIPNQPAAPRVAIAQRRDLGLAEEQRDSSLGTLFQTNTDPSYIDLRGTQSQGVGIDSDYDAFAGWITIAPDWEFIPLSATYQLFPEGRPRSILATSSSARLLPKQILEAAGMSFVSESPRTLRLTYRAVVGSRVLTAASFSLTFGPADATTDFIPPPQAPAVATGATIPVSYDLTTVRGAASPALVVMGPNGGSTSLQNIFDYPGRVSLKVRPLKSYSLPQLKGVINIRVSDLQGGGIYSLQLESSNPQGTPFGYYNFETGFSGDFGYPAFVRVQPSASSARPVAPTLSVSGSRAVHSMELSYAQSTPLQISYDVSNVPHATSALLEVSAPGPGQLSAYNTWDNPNGTTRDLEAT